jgi:hypothetical protein
MMEKWVNQNTPAEAISPFDVQFPLEKEYARVTEALNKAGILNHLINSQKPGITGLDGKEYPVPSREHVAELLAQNRDLVNQKVLQGFNSLELVPMGLPLLWLIDLLQATILKYAAEGKIYRTRQSSADPLVPVRVNPTRQVWIWETLKEAITGDRLVYFPQEYSVIHQGQTKQEVINNRALCAFPGWSVGLAESSPWLAQPGQGKTLNGRSQLETGCSPHEYQAIIKTEPYKGETGKSLEDFITGFLIRLVTTNEVSQDVGDNNALWCLGQYLKVPYADLVPTGRWYRDIGRVRLDMHRTGNKLCTRHWGAATVVRLGLFW